MLHACVTCVASEALCTEATSAWLHAWLSPSCNRYEILPQGTTRFHFCTTPHAKLRSQSFHKCIAFNPTHDANQK